MGDSLSIRRFWGKGARWKRKRERAEGEKPIPFSSPLPPSPTSNLLSPSPLGRSDTQAKWGTTRSLVYEISEEMFYPRDLYGHATWVGTNMADGNLQKHLFPNFGTKA